MMGRSAADRGRCYYFKVLNLGSGKWIVMFTAVGTEACGDVIV